MSRNRASLKIMVQLLGLLLVGYLAVTGFVGYQVGNAIYAVSTSNVVVSIAAGAIGRQAVEQFAIQRANIPSIVQGSPAFWVALRATE